MPSREARVIAIIPARLASTRFPRKALAADTGRPLVEHVAEAAARASSVSEVLVATDSPEIADTVASFGGRAVLTRADHPNGASRIAEACDTLGVPDDAIIVNVQGDEPEIEPDTIDACVDALRGADAPVSTIAAPFEPGEDPTDPNIVKVAIDRRGRALYFSRAPIPFQREGSAAAAPLRHVGLYAYRRPFLRTYTGLAPTPLEQTERLEQLRILEHGRAIKVAVRPCRHVGIDTPDQYAAFVRRWRKAHPLA